MKFVALLSGGKDSCYNIAHCTANGHELVAAASLRPPSGKEEIDSYMYQTVGQDAIELVAQALDVPLFRRDINGTALELGNEYGPRDGTTGIKGDETEDLYELLKNVKETYPDLEGVSVGAILSNYQRVRVEHVCRRLSLTALCYLWQRNQKELLSEMIDAGVEAVLIKVAGIGLASQHLGMSLKQMRATLERLNSLYGAHICGEGGEYETLTLDCPSFKSKIALEDLETVIHSDNDFASVSYLRIKKARLVPKDSGLSNTIIIPIYLEEPCDIARQAMVEISTHPPGPSLQPSVGMFDTSVLPTVRQIGQWVAIANIHGHRITSDVNTSFENEVRACFASLQDQLSQLSLQPSHLSNVNVYLADINMFAHVNVIYVTMFGTSPPARACVAVHLPPPLSVLVDCLAHSDTRSRHALHVQGISYWAPANIGPYSQAVMVDERVFVSGQIGLIPGKMSLPSPPSVAVEAALSFQHVERISQALPKTGRWLGISQCTLVWVTNNSDIDNVKVGWMALYSRKVLWPTLFVVAKALPKNALVETQVLLHTCKRLPPDDDDGSLAKPHFVRGNLGATSYEWGCSYFTDSKGSSLIVALKGNDFSKLLGELKSNPVGHDILASALCMRVFRRMGCQIEVDTFLTNLFSEFDTPPYVTIPTQAISTWAQGAWDIALLVIGV